MNKGRIYLIPSTIGGDVKKTLTKPVFDAINKIDTYVVENIRNARRFILNIDKSKNIDTISFFSFGKHNNLNISEEILPLLLNNTDIGVISDAGLPCIADPGSQIVAFAHEYNFEVIPLVGPSSIFLALMASGLNGQNFSFCGYLPIDKKSRTKKIKLIEDKVLKENQTHLFIETPYRNNQLFESILKNCKNNTKLCLASNLSLKDQYIKTMTIGEWKKTKTNLNKKPTLFIIGQ